VCPTPSHREPIRSDHGSVDVSVQMLLGFMTVLVAVLLTVETVAYWHTRNVYDEAAAEGARVAAAFDGTCTDGIAAATALVRQHAPGWGSQVVVSCTDGPTVVVVVSGPTMGFAGAHLGLTARTAEAAPKER
jgi:ribose/xylose/arabinose/galactoside ABC-type transport system permease subunit